MVPVVFLSDILAQHRIQAEAVPTPLSIWLPALLAADQSPARWAPFISLLAPALFARQISSGRDCTSSPSPNALLSSLRSPQPMTNRLRSSVTGGGVEGLGGVGGPDSLRVNASSGSLWLSAFEARPSGL